MPERLRSDSVSIEVAAPPERVYELVSDITRMGEWSPETVKGVWIDGASTPVVGARFKGSNKRGFVPCTPASANMWGSALAGSSVTFAAT